MRKHTEHLTHKRPRTCVKKKERPDSKLDVNHHSVIDFPCFKTTEEISIMGDYTGTGSEGAFGDVRNPAKQNFFAEDQEKLPVVMTRQNPDYAKRADQMLINILAIRGGRDYVEKRLSRYAGESKIDWDGGCRADGSKATGRKEQSHVFPYPRRIADKIDQYVFGTPPTREGINEDLNLDASADGRSMNDLMIEANDYITAAGWCWIGVDAPVPDHQISKAEKKAKKIRPYINVYSPVAVPDWKYNEIGELEWLITEGMDYKATTPDAKPTLCKVRRVWTPGNVRTIESQQDEEGKWEIVSDNELPTDHSGVPFVLVGQTFAHGYSFDDIESINRSIMDIESVNRANFFKSSYPQPVMPESVLQNTADAYSTSTAEAAEMVFGMNYPILISPEDAQPFYMMPDSGALKAPREELECLKRNMFDAVGLMLQNESKQVASAESKAWDFQDVAQVMKARAKVLENAEIRVAKIVNEFDSSMPEWVPGYNRTFDIGDFNQEIQALIMTLNAPMPVEMTRIANEKLLDRMDRIGAGITPEQREEAIEAIKTYDPTAQSFGDLEQF